MIGNMNDGICKKCNGSGVLDGMPDFSGDSGAVTLSACDCEAGQAQFKRYRPGNKAGYSTRKRMEKVAFESRLDEVLKEMHRLSVQGDADSLADMSYYEAACRSLVAIALHGVDEGARLRAIQYIIDRKLGKAPQAIQLQREEGPDPLDDMTEDERKELLAIALTT